MTLFIIIIIIIIIIMILIIIIIIAGLLKAQGTYLHSSRLMSSSYLQRMIGSARMSLDIDRLFKDAGLTMARDQKSLSVEEGVLSRSAPLTHAVEKRAKTLSKQASCVIFHVTNVETVDLSPEVIPLVRLVFFFA
jgi:hypothetical protein